LAEFAEDTKLFRTVSSRAGCDELQGPSWHRKGHHKCGQALGRSAWRAAAEPRISRARAAWTAWREPVGRVIHHSTRSDSWRARRKGCAGAV